MPRPREGLPIPEGRCRTRGGNRGARPVRRAAAPRRRRREGGDDPRPCRSACARPPVAIPRRSSSRRGAGSRCASRVRRSRRDVRRLQQRHRYNDAVVRKHPNEPPPRSWIVEAAAASHLPARATNLRFTWRSSAGIERLHYQGVQLELATEETSSGSPLTTSGPARRRQGARRLIAAPAHTEGLGAIAPRPLPRCRWRPTRQTSQSHTRHATTGKRLFVRWISARTDYVRRGPAR